MAFFSRGLFLCVAIGLWAGLIIGYVTEYYTSNAYSPVQDVADACRTGAATNVIFGLALGYKSVIIPIFAIAVGIYVSFTVAAMYGIAVAALGMLSTIATGLSIDAYGPISDNAGGIAEMAGMSHRIRERTDALDAAGNTTAAIGKGFAIGSAALVSLALFGAFVSRAGVKVVDVLSPKVIIGLVSGAMLPYWFSAMTMKRGQRSAEDGGGGPLAVRHHPWADGGPRRAGLRPLRQDLHGRVAQGDDAARSAGAARAAGRRHLLRSQHARGTARRRTGFRCPGMYGNELACRGASACRDVYLIHVALCRLPYLLRTVVEHGTMPRNI